MQDVHGEAQLRGSAFSSECEGIVGSTNLHAPRYVSRDPSMVPYLAGRGACHLYVTVSDSDLSSLNYGYWTVHKRASIQSR